MPSKRSISKVDMKSFKNDKSYTDCQPPKRGSSRGTSMASKASSGKKEADPDLNALDDLFPKNYNNAQESAVKSINASLNNSKKNSAENST